MQTLTVDNRASIAALMRCDVSVVEKLLQHRLLHADKNGYIRPDAAMQFLKSSALMSALPRIRKELAAEKAAAESTEAERLAAIESLEKRIQIATAAREWENVAKLQISLRRLDTNKGVEC